MKAEVKIEIKNYKIKKYIVGHFQIVLPSLTDAAFSFPSFCSGIQFISVIFWGLVMLHRSNRGDKYLY